MLSDGNLDSRYFDANGAGENHPMVEVCFSRRISSCSELTASHDYAWFGGRVKVFKLDSIAC